jgi:hypothetical protein
MEALNLNPDPRLQTAPERTALDYGVAVAKVGSIVFPFLGSGVALFDLITAPIRNRRFTDWCEDLRLHLNEVSRRVAALTPETLVANEAFISAFAQATQAALRTHQKEKLEALRNAVLNTALNRVPDDNRRAVFLSLIDRLAPVHMDMLNGFLRSAIPRPGAEDYNYNAWEWKHRNDAKQNPGFDRDSSFLTLWVRDSVPTLANESEYFLRMLIGDLYGAGLTTIGPSDRQVPSSFQQLVTPVGTEFLEFIAAPDLQGTHG